MKTNVYRIEGMHAKAAPGRWWRSGRGAKLSGLRGSAGLGVLFGLNIPACAAPLLAAVFSARARRLLDWLAHQARRFPKWSGVILIALGAWSIYFGLFVEVPVA